MNTIVAFAMRIMGLGKAVDALDGEASKAYAGAVGQILSGLAAILGGLAGLVSQFAACHGGAEYLKFVQGLSQDPSAGAVLAGAALISMGWAAIGQRHALAKNAQAPAAAPVPPAPAPKP
jgi:hypothetical protein